MGRIALAALVALVALLSVPATPTHASSEHGPSIVYFEQTGQYLGGGFLGFWREHGGIVTFGYPLTPEFNQGGVTVQYFERHVFEYHPENPADYRILLRLLGAEARDARGLGGMPEFQPTSETNSGQYFEITGHSIRDGFLSYWESNGGLRIFGYPISTEFRYDWTIVQFTERAIFEYHPDNPADWRILFALLGARAAERDGVDTARQPYDGVTAHYHEDLWRSLSLPRQLRIDKIGVVSNFEHVGRDASGAMAAPDGWNNVAWYNRSVIPGERGNAVVAGHLDAPGGVPAIFWNLSKLTPGDYVTVIAESGNELVFQVTEVERVYAHIAPSNKIFGSSDQRNLNLITCAGSWDHSIDMYDQRLVVYTTLVSD